LLPMEMRKRDITSHFSRLLTLRDSFTLTLTLCD
jgi:hypothetical protein